MNLVTYPSCDPPDDGPDGGASGAVPAVKALQASMAPRASMATRQSEEAPRGGSQPWTAAEYQVPPSHGKDRLVLNQLTDGWLIRSHKQQRKRLFHPLHKGAPVQGENLKSDRVVLEDRWTAAVKDPQKDQWNGWTFFRVKSVNVPGATGDDQSSR